MLGLSAYGIHSYGIILDVKKVTSVNNDVIIEVLAGKNRLIVDKILQQKSAIVEFVAENRVMLKAINKGVNLELTTKQILVETKLITHKGNIIEIKLDKQQLTGPYLKVEFVNV